MKSITFIRHANASWDSSINDFDRPLSQTGIYEANLMGDILVKKELILIK